MMYGEIRLGTSGYSFQDWKGRVYPDSIKNSEMFSYYVSNFRFDMVELNYTYYRIPSARGVSSLVKQSPPGFHFTVKLFGGITHEPWKDFPPTSIDSNLCRQFMNGIEPIIDAGKMGCILAQFPGGLRRDPEAWGYLLSLPQQFEGVRLVYEFRNKSWVADETFELLRRANIGWCAVDEPQMGALMPLCPKVTSDIGYLRLHGRSPYWFKDPARRYDYLYSENELKSFIPVIQNMASESKTLYVAFNNCHAGAAVINVKMLRSLLGIEAPAAKPEQQELFDEPSFG